MEAGRFRDGSSIFKLTFRIQSHGIADINTFLLVENKVNGMWDRIDYSFDDQRAVILGMGFHAGV